MKIAVFHVTGTFSLGGSETNAWALARHLRTTGHVVHFYAGRMKDPVWRYPDVELRTSSFVHRDQLPLLSLRNRKLVERFTFGWNCRKEIAREKYDILNIHKPYDVPFSLWMRKKTGCKIVWRCHGPGLYPGLGRLVDKVDAIYCVSEHTRNELLRNFDVPAAIIYTGVDTEFYTPSSKNTVANGSPRLLFLGRLVKFKQVPHFVRALALLKEHAWTAEIVGDGPLKSEIQDLVRSLGLGNRVQLLPGKRRREEVRDLLKESNVVVFPSSKKETFSNTLLEAMSMGRAVIASDAGGFPEAVTSDHDGILVPAGDPEGIANAILRLIEDRSLLEEISDNGRRTVLERFDSRESFGKVEKLFEDVLSRG